MNIHPDITRNRHGGNEASIAANPTRTQKETDCDRIEQFIKSKGWSFLKEIVSDLGIPVQTASGRIADLKRLGRVEADSNQRVEGCSVLRVKREFSGGLF